MVLLVAFAATGDARGNVPSNTNGDDESERAASLLVHHLEGTGYAWPEATLDCKGKQLTVSWVDNGPFLVALGGDDRELERTWSEWILFRPKVPLRSPRKVTARLRMTVHLDLPEGAEAAIAAVVNGVPVEFPLRRPCPAKGSPYAIQQIGANADIELRCPKCCAREIETTLNVVLKRPCAQTQAAIAIETFEIEVVETKPPGNGDDRPKGSQDNGHQDNR